MAVIPAKAGIQKSGFSPPSHCKEWIIFNSKVPIKALGNDGLNYCLFLLAVACLLELASPVYAKIEPYDIFLERHRHTLAEKGLEFEAIYTGDMAGNMAGGYHHKASYLGNLDLTLTYDLGKAGWIPGGKLFFYALDTHGGQNLPSKYVGDLQVVDNIQAASAMRLYQWWYEQSLFDGRFSFLAGVHDMNSEFMATQYGSLFINSSFGTPPNASANFSASIFPTAGPAVRAKIAPIDHWEFLVGVYDGDPTDGGKNNHGTRYRLSQNQGFLVVTEASYCYLFQFFKDRGPYESRIKFGSWIHTADVADLKATDEDGNPLVHGHNYGLYGILDQTVYREKSKSRGVKCPVYSQEAPAKDPESQEEEEPFEGLAFFVQFGGAPDNRNKVDYYLGVGADYTELIPGRDQDVFGIAVANAFLSESLRAARDIEINNFYAGSSRTADPGELHSNESALEMTYRVQINKHLAIQPDYQIVFNPRGEESVGDAHVLLLRFEFTL